MPTLPQATLDNLSALGGDILALVDEVKQLGRGAVTGPTEPPLSPLRVGNNVLLRTVTVYHVGRVEAITDTEIILSSASWVSDTGRFTDALRTGLLGEVEPFTSPVSVNRSVYVDATDWVHSLPRSQK